MTATVIQTGAAIIQAVAAVAFLIGVCFDFYRRRQERRDVLIEKLFKRWNASAPPGRTEEEAHGIYSPRQTAYFNACLKKMGQKWTYSDTLGEGELPQPGLIFHRVVSC
jgi:hypothetical protein